VVPELSRFFGIVIAMHYNDHVPPHFHARYGSDRATICIRDMTVLEGYLPPRVLGLVVEWAAQHGDELLAFTLAGGAAPQPESTGLPGPELNLTLPAPITTWDEAVPLGNGLMERGGRASTPGSAVRGCACSAEDDSAALRLLWRPRRVRLA
jgi:hypothetical protein